MENIEKRKKVIKISKKGTMVFAVIVIIIGAILLGFKIFSPHNICDFGDCGRITGVNRVATPSFSENSKSVSSDYSLMPYYQNNPTINDTREFLKTNYSAEIQTRNVKRIVLDIKNVVRDVNGRVDSSNENPKNGYVSFVIPKNNFENFKDQIAGITNEKLIIENISSDNLLSQKQSIEQEQNSANASLASLQQQQKNLISKHTENIMILRSNFMGIELEQELASENSSFNANNQNLKNQIENVNSQLSYIAKQDSNFTDNIETVSGSISVRWVSLWELAKIFLPVSPVIIIILIVIIFWLIFRKKSYIPRIEFV